VAAEEVEIAQQQQHQVDLVVVALVKVAEDPHQGAQALLAKVMLAGLVLEERPEQTKLEPVAVVLERLAQTVLRLLGVMEE
jgi:hypothetical protein